MTPTLIAYVLSLPLPVRLALLDADPTGAGWYVVTTGTKFLYLTPPVGCRGSTNQGDAWLPCNPLAIAEHAARLHRHECWPVVSLLDAGWRMELRTIIDSMDIRAIAQTDDKCPHTAVVRLLAEVVGG